MVLNIGKDKPCRNTLGPCQRSQENCLLNAEALSPPDRCTGRVMLGAKKRRIGIVGNPVSDKVKNGPGRLVGERRDNLSGKNRDSR